MAKYNDEDIIWRTIGGRRVPIRKGQSLSEAMKESGKFNKKSKKTEEEKQKMFNDTMDKRESIIKKLDEETKDLSEYDKYNLAISKLENAEGMSATERQYWAGTRDRYEKNMSYDAYDKGVKKSQEFMKEVLSKNNKKDSDYELYKKAKENPDSIDPMTENSTDWEALDKKYSKRYNEDSYKNYVKNTLNNDEYLQANRPNEYFNKMVNEKELHYAGEELYSDDPNRFGDTLRKHNEKMNPSKSRDEVVKQLDNEAGEIKNNKIPRDFEKGYGKFKVETTGSKNLDDRYEITKDEYGQYHAKNLRTGETYQTFADHLRNGNVFEFEDSKGSESKISNYRDSVNEIAKNSAKDNVTLNIDTGEEMNFKSGYSVSFQQSSDNYSDEEYNAKIKECREKCDGNVYVGKYGGDAEPSFHTEDLETAKEIMYKYNQESIYDAKHDTLIMNDKYDASKNKTNYKAETTNDVMNKAIRNKVDKKRGKFKEDLPKKVKIESQGTSNRKEVSENIQAHILSYYDKPEDFVQHMDAMSYLPTNWHRGEELAKGGSYMIYYDDQRKFLDELKINPKGKKFSDDRVAQTYNSLIGRESAKLYDRLKKNAYKKYLAQHPGSEMSFAEFKEMTKED